MTTGATSLFEPRGDWFLPTELTLGPWSLDAMHGGPPGALLGRAVDLALEPGEVAVRVGLDLESAVPLEPVRIEVQRVRSSRRVARLIAELHTAERRVATCRVVALRTEAFEVEPPARRGFVLPSPEAAVEGPPAFHEAPVIYHRDAVEHRFEVGGFATPGKAICWTALHVEVVAGEANSPLAHLMAAADFGSGLSQRLHGVLSSPLINVDVSVSLSRAPVERWIRLEPLVDATVVDSSGVGLATTGLADRLGPFGVVTQAQLGYARTRSHRADAAAPRNGQER
jgi:hypothetical protein